MCTGARARMASRVPIFNRICATFGKLQVVGASVVGEIFTPRKATAGVASDYELCTIRL